VLIFAQPAAPADLSMVSNNDTIGESFELNVAAAQEAGTLIGTAKPITLAQGSVRGKWNRGYFYTA
jgi:hypothetical protein